MLVYLTGWPSANLGCAAPTVHWPGLERYRSLGNVLGRLPRVDVVLVRNRGPLTLPNTVDSCTLRQGRRYGVSGCPESRLGPNVLNGQRLGDYVAQHIYNGIRDALGGDWYGYSRPAASAPQLPRIPTLHHSRQGSMLNWSSCCYG
jgi:hypothetical protein